MNTSSLLFNSNRKKDYIMAKLLKRKTATPKPAAEEELLETTDVAETTTAVEEDETVEEQASQTKTAKKPALKKAAAKPVAKVETPAEEDDSTIEEEAQAEETSSTKNTARSLFGAPKRKVADTRVFEEGDMLTREELVRRFCEVHPEYPQGQVASFLKQFEKFVEEGVLGTHPFKFFGGEFKLGHVAARDYSGNGGLSHVEDNGLVTRCSEHTVVSYRRPIGRTSDRGMFDDDGNFVSGNVVDGEFVEGTWTNNSRGLVKDFVPATKAKAKAKK